MSKTFLIAILGFTLLVGAPLVAQTFTTVDAPVAIPDNSVGVISACQTITVAGGPNPISDVNVELGADHSWIGDMTVRLTRDPSGTPTVLTLMNRPARTATGAGDSSDMSSAFPVQFTDTPAATVSAENMGLDNGGGAPGGADNVCEFDSICQFISAPDAADTPNAGQGTDLSDFVGLDSNVTWELCVADSAGGDTGTLTTWSLGFGTLPVELQSFEIE